MLPRMLWVLAVVCLAGCQESRSKVLSIDPANQARVGTERATITVVFDRPMLPATINDGTFRVEGTKSGTHQGSVVVSDDAREALFVITGSFAAGETVTVVLSSSIRSASKKPLKGFTSSFFVESEPVVERDPFDFVSMSPALESNAAPRLTAIAIEFSAPYNPFTASASTVVVQGERSGARTLSFGSLFAGGNTLRFTADRGFLAGERVSVSLSELLSSLEGARLDTPYVGAFRVANAGSEWPTSGFVSDAASPPGGHLAFLDADADGLDEWIVVYPDGTLHGFELVDDAAIPVESVTLSAPGVGLAIGDFDGDGRVDVACLDSSGESLALLPGSPQSARFLDDEVVIALNGVFSAGVSSGHFDGDGLTDLWVWSSSPTATAALLWGDSDLPLESAVTLSELGVAGGAVGLDFNRDGLPDLAYPTSDGHVGLLSGRGERAFEERTALPPESRSTAVFAANFDDDDRADLLSAADAGAPATVFLSNGDGSFRAQSLDPQVATSATVVADWDGDGLLDLLTPTPGAAEMTIHYGLGDGSFSPPDAVTTAAPLTSIALGDANGDGALDIGLTSESRPWEVAPAAGSASVSANLLVLPDVSGSPGEGGIAFEIVADHDGAVEGFTTVFTYDATRVTIDTLSTAGTDAGAIGVEFEIPRIEPAEGYALVAVIFDFVPPFDRQILPAGVGQRIVGGTLTIASGAPAGPTALSLENSVGSPPQDNVFVVAGLNVFPVLEGGAVIVASGSPSGGQFVRGDANNNGILSLADSTFINSYVFNSGPAPQCFDAADANDDGVIDLTDAVVINAYLFGGGDPLPPPFPNAGEDPTDDSLTCAND